MSTERTVSNRISSAVATHDIGEIYSRFEKAGRDKAKVEIACLSMQKICTTESVD